MPQELSIDYDIDPREYLDRIEEIVTERHPPTRTRDVEEVIFADGGPIDHLIWYALDDYDDHTFFYYDGDPDPDLLRRLLSMMPTKEEIPKFRVLLQSQYDTLEVVELRIRQVDLQRLNGVL